MDTPVPLDALLAHRAWVHALARRVVTDPNTADDVEQDTWLEAIKRPPRHAGALRAWLSTVVLNAARQTGRRATRRARREEAVARGPERSAADVVADAELLRRLVEALMALDEPYRATVLFRFYDGLPPRDIAARMGVPVETVRTRLRRGIELLRGRMERRERKAWMVLLGGPPAPSTHWGTEVAMGAAKKVAVAAALLLLVVGGAWVATTSLRRADAPGTEISRPAGVDDAEAGPSQEAAARNRGGRSHIAASGSGPTAEKDEGDPKHALLVVVRDPSGQALSGAEVELHERSLGSSDDWLREIASTLGQGVPAVATARTDVSGHARLPQGATSAQRRVVAHRTGFGGASAYIGNTRSVELVLLPGYAVQGRVVDAKGRPVAGAVVLGGSQRQRWAMQTGNSEEGVRAIADDAGRFVLDGLPVGTDVFCAAWPGGMPVFVGEAVIPSTRVLDLVLPGGGAIEGTVTDEGTGTAIVDAIVSAVRNLDSMAFGFARTDASGRYRIDGFGSDFVNEIHVHKSGYCDVPRAYSMPSRVVPADGVARWDVAVRRGAKLSGRVLGPAGPVPGARVTAARNDPLVSFGVAKVTTVSDASGRFTFDSLVPGPTVLVVSAEGVYQEGFPPLWTSAVREGTAPADAKVDVAAEGETTHDVHVGAGLTVSGRVEGPDGAPVAGATVSFYAVGGHESDGPDPGRHTESEADGTFTIRGAPIAQKASVSASANNFAREQREIELDPAIGAKDVVLRLGAGATLHGRVIAAAGTPLRDVVALVTTLPDPRWPECAWDNTMPHPVAPDGSFEVPIDVREGTYVARVVASGFAVADSAPIRITPAERTYQVEIRLDAGCRVVGNVVVRGSGEPIARARVRLQRVDPNAPPPGRPTSQPKPPLPVAATSDAMGAFSIDNMAAGTYDVVVDSDHMSPETLRVSAPRDEPMRVELAPTGTISGRVRFVDGKPAVGVLVFLSSPRQVQSLTTVADADGSFRFDDLPESTYSMEIQAAALAPGANILRKSLNNPQLVGEPIDVTVEPALAIGGTLLDDAGKPFDSASIAVFRDDRDPPDSFQSGSGSVLPTGRFEVRGLEPGSYTVRVAWSPRREGTVYTSTEVHGVAAGSTNVALVATPSLAIEGTVALDEHGAVPVDGIEARLVDRPALGRGDYVSHPWARPDSRGRFRIDGLSPGRYRLVAKSSGYRESPLQPRPADSIVQAGARDVRLKLDSSSTISGRMTFGDRAMMNTGVSATPVGGGPQVGATSDNDGNFALIGLDPSRRYDLRGYAQGVVPARVANVPVGTTDVKLVFERGLSAKGRVLRADGTPLGKTGVYLRSPTAMDATGYAMTAEDGTFEVTGLLEGEYKAQVYVPVQPTADGQKRNEARDVGTVRAGDTAVVLRLPE